MIIQRIAIDCAIAILAYIAPAFLPCIVAIVCVFFFEYFFEIMILGVMLDLIYGAGDATLWQSYLYSIGAVTVFIVTFLIKRQLRV